MGTPLVPYFEPGQRVTFQATAGVTGKRFVDVSADAQVGWNGLSTTADGGNIKAAHAAAGTKVIGVATDDVASGDKGALINDGIVPVTSDGAINYGDMVAVGASGKAKVATAGQHIVGRALATSVDGGDCMVFLLIAGGGGGGIDIVAQTHIADTSAPLAAITGGESPTEAEFNLLRGTVATLVTNQNAIFDALEANGILATS